ncbi:MAG TPA: bifunctional diaminohydroxyphosphoribosylaminopyrimidine deaminase/5-amino-6-(5-phosphoribosylamino)uracil reductase RibD [Cyclobacteriaceae bacterium]|nr:bifunctional diaminohydroxyphosphoribosylaminopyrimidine deaminase/5-amino-6-(5-phosphoribosylamino)uracil reductase RibD [Cyclobacteriaceae bacterium]HRG79665.1 bifunctional diaminohydroxyphosphoribosylaminopyrimidine deaminase/5-amino-6-(5-phosphoribosylamino)uracil reductase RibD [Cyclobacteriaceae bacterium]
MTPDELLILRTFELARLGIGSVSPNPQVGCVIVKDGIVIGEGWHQKFGQAHAEVNAVASVKDKGLIQGSTVYVNLEPCSHTGKTPPCADMLIEHRVKKVIISNVDTNPLVGGNGVKKLMDAGIEVITGVLEKEGRELNKRFFTFHEQQRPYIVLKWAQTADGFIARSNYESKWISNEFSRLLVHKWRSEEDAVLVGTKTAAHDNPMLTVRDWSGRDPVRLVIDRFLRLPDKLNLFDGSIKTICFNLLKHEEHANLSLVRLDEQDFLISLVDYLASEKIQSVMIEGGSLTLSMFINAGLWDEARVFTSPRLFHTGIAAPSFRSNLLSEENIFTDTLRIYQRDTLKPNH